MASSHCLYLCTCLVSADGSVRMSGKWCDLSGRGLGIGGLGGVGFYGWWGFSRVSKILFEDMYCSPFMWLFLENSTYMKKCSIVLRCVPFPGIVGSALFGVWGRMCVIVLQCVWHNWRSGCWS